VSYPPLRKTITVPWDPERAFRRFTAETSAWWPLATHSVGQDKAEAVVLEGRVGGRILEKIRGCDDSVWGTITAWEPPRRLAFTWHPGGTPAQATRVDVSFEPAEGGTRLVLVHSDWEKLGPLAKLARRGYPLGWAYVLRLWAGRRHSPLVLGLQALQAVMRPLQRRAAERAMRRTSP
jgi:uncharacterized protein YndB with AHSA1/START domain